MYARSRFVLLLLLTSMTASAQGPGRNGMGIKLGPQWCNLNASDRTYQPVPGALVGIYFPLLASARLELQPELLLSYQGSNFPVGEAGVQELRMLYLQAPLIAKVYLGNAFSLQGGLLMARCLAAQRDGEKITDTFRAFDVGYAAGIGVDTQRGLDITARYCAGTSPLLVETTGVNPRSRSIQATAGLRIVRFRPQRMHFRKG